MHLDVDATPPPSPAIPAATVVLVRDTTAGLETLMVHKSKDLRSFAGAWVFPGGRVDDADWHDTADERVAARRAAVREAREEADLDIAAESLVAFSHWEPPLQERRRFSTWFFLAPDVETAVTVDGGEILEHAWLRPVDALARRDAGTVQLVPPTFVTLSNLARVDTVAEAMAWARSLEAEPERFVTHFGRSADGRMAFLWAGDAGYETTDPDATGPRHRVWLNPTWVYEREGC